jgi:ribonuclease T2
VAPGDSTCSPHGLEAEIFSKASKLGLIALLAVLGSLQSASARHRQHGSDAAPGEFDYYVLSLSWSPAFCLQKPGSAECNGPRRYGFVVHGLWPQNARGWPENCDVRAQVSDAVVQGMADLMPARGLVFHEWSAHGTCSGLEPSSYFALVRRAYTSVAIPSPLVRPTAAAEQAPAAIVKAFFQANPQLPPQSVGVTCSGQSVPRLREVHICFDRGLKPRPCSADALRAACRAPSVLIPPIR